MLPEGFSTVDHQISMLLGEIKGQVENLSEDFKDEREQARLERRILFEKIGQQDVIRSELDALVHKVDGMRTQIYSNKAEIDILKNAGETEKKISLHTVKLVSLFGTVLAAVATALYVSATYLLNHWHEVAAFFKAKP